VESRRSFPNSTGGVSLTIAPGQRATVEVIREFYSKAAAEAAAKGLTEPEPDFIGPRNEILAEFEPSYLERTSLSKEQIR